MTASLRALVVLACLAILAAALQQARELVVPFLLAAFVAVACEPPLAWLRARGLTLGALAAAHARVFAVRALAVEYLAPGRLDDALTVGTRLREARPASLRFAQELRRGADCLARAEVKVACLDAASGRPAALPAALDWSRHA